MMLLQKGDTVKIRCLDHLKECWHNRESEVKSVYLDSSVLWVEVDLDGISLVFKEGELFKVEKIPMS